MGPAPSFRCLVPRPQTSFRHLGTGPSHLGTLGPAQTVGLAVGMLRDDVQKRILLTKESCSARTAHTATADSTHSAAHGDSHGPHAACPIHMFMHTPAHMPGSTHMSVHIAELLVSGTGASFPATLYNQWEVLHRISVPSNQCSIESVFHRIAAYRTHRV